MLSLFELIAALLGVTAVFAWANHRFIGMPANIGLLVMGLGASLLMIAVELLLPDTAIFETLARAIGQIDFYEAVMHGLLGFLLFAGALHVDLGLLKRRATVVGSLAAVGVPINMAVIATGFWLTSEALGLGIGFLWCIVFGALIAPTDPVAVLSTLKSAKVPRSLETDMSGEALFNDGIGVVLFIIAVELASGAEDTGFVSALRLLVVEAGGGALLGLATGWLAYRLMRSIDDYPIEVMISLALVSVTYAVADRLHMSGPIAVVVAGVLIGNHGMTHAMSETTRRYLADFWTLIDEILNALLFLLIGLEVVLLGFDATLIWIALIAVPLALAARFLAVAVPVVLLSRWQRFVPGTVAVLTWGGVRGGISVALALSLPEGEARAPILHATYAVVIFSVIVQGLSLGAIVRRFVRRGETEASGQADGTTDARHG